MPRRMISVMRHFPLICIDYHYIVVMKQLCRKKFLEVSCLGFICFSKEVFFPSLQSIYHCAHRKQFCQNIFCRRVLLFFQHHLSLYFSLTLPVELPHLRYVKYLTSLSCLLRNNFFPPISFHRKARHSIAFTILLSTVTRHSLLIIFSATKRMMMVLKTFISYSN